MRRRCYVLYHNHIQHNVDMPIEVNGFRARFNRAASGAAELRLRRLACLLRRVMPFRPLRARARGATLPKPRWLLRAGPPFRRARFLPLQFRLQPPTTRRSRGD
jgi:hypothetical protein